MSCSPEILREVPFFGLLDDDELAVLAAQVDLRTFARQQRIYKIGSPGGTAYVLVSGSVRVTTLDEDNQEVTVDRPEPGGLFGFASLFDETPHQTDATAIEVSVCIEIDRGDIAQLLERKPHAGMDLLTAVSRQIHSAHALVRSRTTRNANEVIEEQATWAERLADDLVHFGGSWAFIIAFCVALVIYSAINVYLGQHAWDPYPFILLNLILSMLAALQAPVIMMSQNRQDHKDRVRSELDFDVNRRAESEIRNLSHRLYLIDEKLADLHDHLRDNA